jgi:transcriptional regulator with XRE-family HTH domain
MEITPEQIRAARALLRLEQADLAERAHVSVATVRRLETVDSATKVAPTTVGEIRRALEAAGAEFITNGVRRRPALDDDPEALFRDLRALSERSAAALAAEPAFSKAELYDVDGLPG